MKACPERSAALALLRKYNAEPFHIQHALTVEGVMRWYANELGYGEDADFWATVGLLHDVDFEKWPEQHCKKAPELLSEIGCGDALIHALCDALLGAAAMGDIGLHFPDTSERFKGIDSRILLRHTVEMLRDKGYRIGNVDCTLCLQRPKIKPYIAAMRETLAETMGIDPERVSVKATTTERLGFVGREEGVEAHAVALVYRETP